MKPVLVLDSNNPVVIMPNNLSNNIKEIHSGNHNINDEKNELYIETDDINELENIQELLKKQNPEREDGIKLIINDDYVKEERETSEKGGTSDVNGENEKKTINL